MQSVPISANQRQSVSGGMQEAIGIRWHAGGTRCMQSGGMQEAISACTWAVSPNWKVVCNQSHSQAISACTWAVSPNWKVVCTTNGRGGEWREHAHVAAAS